MYVKLCQTTLELITREKHREKYPFRKNHFNSLLIFNTKKKRHKNDKMNEKGMSVARAVDSILSLDIDELVLHYLQKIS